MLIIFNLFYFPIEITKSANSNNKSVKTRVVALFSFVPYLLGCYATFYLGFWSIKSLFSQFNTSDMLVSILFIILVFMVVSATHKISECGNNVDSETILIEE